MKPLFNFFYYYYFFWEVAWFSLYRPSGPIQSISRFVRLSVCLSVRLSVCVCVFTFEVPFKRLFAPFFQSRMSNIFRDSESLGKSNGKKWSHIWTILFENCQKSPRKKKFFFCWFCGPVSVRRLYNDMRRLYWDMRRLYWYDQVILRLVLDDFFRFSKKSGFWVFLVHPPMPWVLLSASVERFSVSRMRDFFFKKLHISVEVDKQICSLPKSEEVNMHFFLSYSRWADVPLLRISL